MCTDPRRNLSGWCSESGFGLPVIALLWGGVWFSVVGFRLSWSRLGFRRCLKDHRPGHLSRSLVDIWSPRRMAYSIWHGVLYGRISLWTSVSVDCLKLLSSWGMTFSPVNWAGSSPRVHWCDPCGIARDVKRQLGSAWRMDWYLLSGSLIESLIGWKVKFSSVMFLRCSMLGSKFFLPFILIHFGVM